MSAVEANGAVAARPTGEPMLKVEDLVVRYGQVEALHGLSIDVYPGEVAALIGSNGAGKSTTLRAISGMIRPAGGRILFEGRDITGLPSHHIVCLGLGHVPEGRQVFANQSVRDNLLLGGYAYSRDKAGAQAIIDREFQRFPVLRERQDQLAGTLSGGEQQMLAISRGLMSRPRMLLMDEPSMGLAPLLVKQVANTIQALKAEGVTILLVEQLAAMALYVAERAYVIQNGNVRLEGPSRGLARNPEVVRAYLGGAAQHEGL
jgi:branched-chain amino acid transport system ATP-binding protein